MKENNISYVTNLEISIMHENENDTDGLDDVLMNIVRKWDYELTPAVYQKDPIPIDKEIQKWVNEFYP